MPMLPESSSRRRLLGAELVLGGGAVLFLAKTVIGLGIPLAILGYGLFKWLGKGQKAQGMTSAAFGVLLYFLLANPLNFIFWIPNALAGLALVLGGAMMVFPGGKTEAEPPAKPGEIIEIKKEED